MLWRVTDGHVRGGRQNESRFASKHVQPTLQGGRGSLTILRCFIWFQTGSGDRVMNVNQREIPSWRISPKKSTCINESLRIANSYQSHASVITRWYL